MKENIKYPKTLLGAQVSIAGSLDQAFTRGESIGCNVIQIFTKNNRQWTVPALRQEEIKYFKETWQKSGITSVTGHACYLINLGSPDHDVHKKSIDGLINELHRCNQLEIPTLVLHPGSHVNTNEKNCLDQITKSINSILEEDQGTTALVLEIMAGQGSSVCYSFEQLAYICSQIKQKQRIGVCFDTCHAFAAGYDFRTPKTYENLWQEFDSIIGLEKLMIIHLNDSKKELGSKVDRHEKIGKGKLGLTPFSLLMNDERFFSVPKILETPEGTLEDYAVDIATLISLLSPKTKKILAARKG